ncbi:MAG: hypothetical protein ABJA10_01245, partial [Aestuariivirga sp.]
AAPNPLISQKVGAHMNLRNIAIIAHVDHDCLIGDGVRIYHRAHIWAAIRVEVQELKCNEVII